MDKQTTVYLVTKNTPGWSQSRFSHASHNVKISIPAPFYPRTTSHTDR